MNKVSFVAFTLLMTAIIGFDKVLADTTPLPQINAVGLKETNQSVLAEDVDVIVKQETIWKKDYESYFEGTIDKELMTSRAISETLRNVEKQTGKKPAVIYMIPAPEQLKLFLVTPGKKLVIKQIKAANKEALLKITKELQTRITDPRELFTTSYLASAQQLYQWMIKPIEKDLKAQNIDTLMLCVGAGLRSVPFSALHDGQKFLVERYAISLIPAFSLTDTRYADIRNSSVLAMGASQFQNLEPLPAVPLELSTIVENKGGNRFLNNQFTLDNLLLQRRRESYKIIHLATHGIFQAGAVNNSYIQFWNNKLQLNQLRTLQLNSPSVDLLVLSACRTALGDKQAELGFSGLAVETGAKSAMGSLWSVDDLGTLALMTEFYSNLKTAPIKAEALRQTQMRMLNKQVWTKQGQLHWLDGKAQISLPAELAKLGETDFSHPYYWAAFTMIGSPW